MKKVFLTLLLVSFTSFSCNLKTQKAETSKETGALKEVKTSKKVEAPKGVEAHKSIDAPKGIDMEYINAVDKLMEVSGAKTTLKAQFPIIMSNLREMLKGVPNDVFAKIESKYQEIFLKRMTEFYAPIYNRYFTLEDIKGYITFYETNLGRKVARTNPSLMNDLYQAGQQVGVAIGQSVVEELQAEGFDTKGL
ncbi:DUF2059 domain-containing protein [Prevotella intermedia]|uniref:DUF2059 domain-containing protein n=1 Tax=Prevotella intermedia TaxID=28131 RepID=UPI000BE75C63|nr:DUF2059 domain-containing protein [Prevotella intermedia]PDP81576.1 hypothetical protein CLI69_08625 [Prevotella intermedia]